MLAGDGLLTAAFQMLTARRDLLSRSRWQRGGLPLWRPVLSGMVGDRCWIWRGRGGACP